MESQVTSSGRILGKATILWKKYMTTMTKWFYKDFLPTFQPCIFEHYSIITIINLIIRYSNISVNKILSKNYIITICKIIVP